MPARSPSPAFSGEVDSFLIITTRCLHPVT
jgi:hypothetical protein